MLLDLKGSHFASFDSHEQDIVNEMLTIYKKVDFDIEVSKRKGLCQVENKWKHLDLKGLRKLKQETEEYIEAFGKEDEEIYDKKYLEMRDQAMKESMGLKMPPNEINSFKID